MDTKQLKEFASRLGNLLSARQHPIKHGQALDLIAAVPGLRNWPEVVAFPERVTAAALSVATCERLSQRVAAKLGVALDSMEMMEALTEEALESQLRTQVWPQGPTPGVYVTTSEQAIDALVRHYEQETSGAPLYAERAGGRAESAIDLGEHGIFSNGLLRIPSGTLIVVGPVELTQESWENNRDRLNVAASLAEEGHHRVAILCATPAPDNLRNDVALLCRYDETPVGYVDGSLRGVVEEDGALVTVSPFVDPIQEPIRATRRQHSSTRLPPEVSSTIAAGLAVRQTGFILLASTEERDIRASSLEAILAVTDAIGPAARIQPSFSGDYDDSTPLSTAFLDIPVLPSVESAYVNGYRRFVIEVAWAIDEDLTKYSDKACFILGTYGTRVTNALATVSRRMDYDQTVAKMIAVVCEVRLESKRGRQVFYDAIAAQRDGPTGKTFDQVDDFVHDRRCVRWEEQLERLLTDGAVTAAQLRKEFRNGEFNEFLNARRKGSLAKQ